jgi:hypothetical protein
MNKDGKLFNEDFYDGARFICLLGNGHIDTGEEYTLKESPLEFPPDKSFFLYHDTKNTHSTLYTLKDFMGFSFDNGKHHLEIFPVDRLTPEELFVIRMTGDVHEVFGKPTNHNKSKMIWQDILEKTIRK